MDKRHGTERCVAEQVERLSKNYDIHLYCQMVEDIAGVMRSKRFAQRKQEKENDNNLTDVIWHKVPSIPGPHILRYLWWFLANHLYRWWDRKIKGLKYDLVYTPGINCLDADVIIVHHVFAEYFKCVKEGLSLKISNMRSWLRLIHRYMYYKLIIALEKIIYRKSYVVLGAVSHKVAELLKQYYGREAATIYHGTDFSLIGNHIQLNSHEKSRKLLNISELEFVLLLVGNDWNEKGLPSLLKAMKLLKDLPLLLLVRGRDDKILYEKMIQQLGLQNRVHFLEPVPDIFQIYAAADLYVGPSLYDSFAMPPAEAMACGLPVIVSSRAGVSEIITDGVDGLILVDPLDVNEIANKIQLLYENNELRKSLGQKGAQTSKQYTWARNAEQMQLLLEKTLAKRFAVS